MKFNLGSGTKSIIKKVSLVLAGVTAVTAVGFGAKAIYDRAKDDLKTITPTFEVGNLGADGKYVNDESTLYTKEAFGCYGLQVKRDFDSTVNYQLFYYDILDNFVSASAVLSNGFSEEAPINGAYARMVITPREDEDGKISLLERVSYPSQLTVKVKKEQDIENRFDVFKGKILQVVSDTENLVFTNTCYLDVGTLEWLSDSHMCSTTTTLLSVKSGSTLTFDSTLFTDLYSNIYCNVFEFKEFPLKDNYVSCTRVNGNSNLTLGGRTKFIIISVNNATPGESWLDTDVAKLPSCFSISK